jgi:hypothetical protein
MRKEVVILLLLLLCVFCNRNEQIKLEDISGTYEYTYIDNDPKWDKIKHVVIINVDSTYAHKMYHGNKLLVDEQGFYEFNRFVPCIAMLEFTAYNKHLYDTLSKRKSFAFMLKRSIFGSVYLTFNWGFDPDGAPTRPKYKKIR